VRRRSRSVRPSVSRGPRFWVRFGGASNVDVLFGGKPVSVPSGTVALVLSRPSRL
jgi:hypothetical protein